MGLNLILSLAFFWSAAFAEGTWAAEDPGTFTVPITEPVTVIPLPIRTCYDTGIFIIEKFDTHDPNHLYGIKIEALDNRGNILAWSTVTESYVPAAHESSAVFFPPDSVSVRCTIFGPDLEGKWQGASFRFEPRFPKLGIRLDGAEAVLEWEKIYGDCWDLEKRTDDKWGPSDSRVPTDNTSALFRLVRKL